MGRVSQPELTLLTVWGSIGQATQLGRAGAGGYWLGTGDKSTFDHMTTDPETSRANRVDLLRQHGAVELADQAGDTLAMMAERAVDGDLWEGCQCLRRRHRTAMDSTPDRV